MLAELRALHAPLCWQHLVFSQYSNASLDVHGQLELRWGSGVVAIDSIQGLVSIGVRTIRRRPVLDTSPSPTAMQRISEVPGIWKFVQPGFLPLTRQIVITDAVRL